MHHVVHARRSDVEILAVDARLVACVVLLVAQRIGAVEAHHVGRDIVAAVGHNGGQVGHLDGHHRHLALTNRVRVDGREGPPLFAIPAVVVGRVGDVACREAALGQVDIQLLAEAEAQHILAPYGQAILRVLIDTFILTLLYHTAIDLIEVGVATHLDSLLHRPGRGVVVATHQALVAHKAAVGRNHTQVKCHHRLRHLEDGARRILTHQGSVEHRLGQVAVQLLVVLAADASHQQIGVVAGSAHHSQQLARRRLQRHHASALVGHQLLGILLQVGVERRVEVHALLRQRIVGAALIRAHLAVVHVYMHDFLALHATQHLLVALLQATLADVVALLVVGVAVDVGLIHLAHITQHLRRNGAVVDAQRAL